MLNKNKFALLFGFVLVLVMFSNVSASCCVRTTNNQFCIDDLTTGCEVINNYGSCSDAEMSECNKGTCVPNNGVCLSDYSQAQCDFEGGRWVAQPKEEVAECQIGCCKETSVCGVIQKNQCSGEFDSGVTNSATCDSQCAVNELGCCVSATDCVFGERGDCTETFEATKQCNEIQVCNGKYESHKYTACGDNELISNSELDVYWYDSNENMEEKVGTRDSSGRIRQVNGEDMNGTCNYPDEKCYDPDEKGGRENAYCKSTACVVEGDCPECNYHTFLHGESICLTLFKGHFTNDQRSKYLREYVLSCDSGEVVEDRELNRAEEICVDNTITVDGVERKKANVIPNEWSSCLDCGSGGGLFDYGGYIPVFGAVPMSVFGSWCGSGRITNSVPGGFGAQTCDDITGQDGAAMCYYDNDFWAPLGSCNPIYTPSIDTDEQCGKCGRGGDSSTNVCTEQECNALGDCQFYPDGGLDVGGLAQTGALALGGATAAMAASQFACHIPFVPTEACFQLSLGTVGNVFGSSLFWGVYSLFIGSTVGMSQGYEDMYDVSFDKGTYHDLAQKIVAAKAVSTSLNSDEEVNNNYWLGSRASIGQGMNLLSLFTTLDTDLLFSFESNIIGIGMQSAEDFGRQIIFHQSYNQAYLANGGNLNILGFNAPNPVAHEAAVNIADEAAVSASRDEAIQTGSKFAKALKVAGIAYSVYSASEAWQTGECRPETAYTDSNRCEQCGPGEGQFFCTEQRCEVLGGDTDHCLWISKEDGTDDGICTVNDPGNVALPNLNRIYLELYDINDSFVVDQEVNDNVLEMESAVDWNKAHTVKLNITTDIRAICKADFAAESEFSAMEHTFSGVFTTDHTLTFNLTEEIKSSGEATLFVKCNNTNGVAHNANEDMNQIILKFGARPDVIPPVFKSVDPYNAFNLPEGTDNVTVTLKVYDNNGVRGCKYSEEKVNYGEMEYTFTKGARAQCPGSSVRDCDTFTARFDLGDAGQEIDLTSMGYDETGTLYSYVFGCVDELNNLIVQNYSFTVYPSFGLNFTAPREGEEIYTTRPTIKLETEVISQCLYKFDNEINWTKMNEIVDTRIYDYKIKRDITSSPEGTQHTLYVKCMDIGHNIAEESVNFYAVSDVQPSYPVRIYTSGTYGSGKLHVLLNERASCKFETDSADYEYEDAGTPMSAVPPENEEQQTTWNSNVFYIKCKDEFGNIGGFTVYP